MDRPYNPPPDGLLPDFQIGTAHNKHTKRWHVMIVESCSVHGVHEFVSAQGYATEDEAKVAAKEERATLVKSLSERDGVDPTVIDAPDRAEFYTPPASKFNPLNN